MAGKKVGVNKTIFKADTQRISNNQNVNPSFNFTWDTTKPTVKAFARVRKCVNNTGIGIISDSTQERQDKVTKKLEKDVIKPIIRFPKSIQKSKGASKIADDSIQVKAIIPDKLVTKYSAEASSERPVIRFPKVASKNIKHVNKSESPKITGHIKRKQRKDKLLAKLHQRQEGDNIEKPSGSKQYEKVDKKYSLFSEKPKMLHVQSQSGKSVCEKVFSEEAFTVLNIHQYLISNLNKIGYDKLTNVQAKAIPTIMEGKNTLIRSQTGSGKTLAYALPIVNDLQGTTPRITRTDGVRALIVVPTRELALQVHELFNQINTFQWIVVSHLCGGENRKSEKDRLRKGVNILIGTPGRLLDHVLHTTALRIDKVKYLILDEADRLLDMGFRKDIVSLVEALDQAKLNTTYNAMAILKKSQNYDNSETPEIEIKEETNRQTILLSATLSKDVADLAEFAMKDHVYIDALDYESNVFIDSFVIPDTVKQFFLPTFVRHRLFTLSALLIGKSKTYGKTFVFMASGLMVDYHYALFTKCLIKMPKVKSVKHANVPLYDSDEEDELVMDIEFFKLHGSMDQKERKDIFTRFRKAKTGVLICTDVASRGVDVPHADCIIQYTGPQTDEDYLHRIGRTGRAGQSGEAIIFLTHEEQEYVNHLRDHRVFLKKLNREPYIRQLCTLMGNPNAQEACTALQQRFENAVANCPDLLKMAYFAYSSWSRFYNSYPTKMRKLFDFKRIIQGHYVTSFGIRDTPTAVARQIRDQVEMDRKSKPEKRLNKKLANHPDEDNLRRRPKRENGKLLKETVSLTTSEFDSGLEPLKKKQKKLNIY